MTVCRVPAGYVTSLLSGKQKEGLESLTDLSWGVLLLINAISNKNKLF